MGWGQRRGLEPMDMPGKQSGEMRMSSNRSNKDKERMLLAGSVSIKGAAVSHKNRGIWNWLQSLKMWKLPSQPVG